MWPFRQQLSVTPAQLRYRQNKMLQSRKVPSLAQMLEPRVAYREAMRAGRLLGQGRCNWDDFTLYIRAVGNFPQLHDIVRYQAPPRRAFSGWVSTARYIQWAQRTIENYEVKHKEIAMKQKHDYQWGMVLWLIILSFIFTAWCGLAYLVLAGM